MIQIHGNWESPAWDLDPAAPQTGPFCRRHLLETWWRERGPSDGDLLFAETGTALLPLWVGDEGAAFLGEPDLFDYHSPLGTDIPGAIAALAEHAAFPQRFLLDSLPEEAATEIVAGLEKAGVECETEEHEVAAVLDLPDDFESYLAGIGKKERHEVRRKRRRFAAEQGEWHLDTRSDLDALGEFVRMHRLSPGEKGEFMTDAMAEFFGHALTVPGAGIDLLRNGEGSAVAASFAFVDRGTYFLYNSAYDPEFSSASPGQVMLSVLIEAGIENGLRRFDFLKGDEAYKFRLGAGRRPLFAVRSTG